MQSRSHRGGQSLSSDEDYAERLREQIKLREKLRGVFRSDILEEDNGRLIQRDSKELRRVTKVIRLPLDRGHLVARPDDQLVSIVFTDYSGTYRSSGCLPEQMLRFCHEMLRHYVKPQQPDEQS